MFGFVIQIGAVVAERELKLRQAMDTMGLKVSVFWLTWVAWEIVLVFISSLFIVIFGLMFQARALPPQPSKPCYVALLDCLFVLFSCHDSGNVVQFRASLYR